MERGERTKLLEPKVKPFAARAEAPSSSAEPSAGAVDCELLVAAEFAASAVERLVAAFSLESSLPVSAVAF